MHVDRIFPFSLDLKSPTPSLPILFRPVQGLSSFWFVTQGGARFTSLALGYYLSGLRSLRLSRLTSPATYVYSFDE
jgi:hypothetical protein